MPKRQPSDLPGDTVEHEVNWFKLDLCLIYHSASLAVVLLEASLPAILLSSSADRDSMAPLLLLLFLSRVSIQGLQHSKSAFEGQ